MNFAALFVLAALTSPTPSPSPPPFRSSVDVVTTFVGTSTGGPGTVPPEGSAFARGSPLSPNTPYDLFSAAPLIPGNAGQLQLNFSEHYSGSRFVATGVLGAAFVTGSIQNAAYWGENLLPPLNVHLGYTTLPYRIAFPPHAGGDDAAASVIAPLFASFGARDERWLVRAGFFDLNQSDRFVFVQPALTSVTPNIGLQTAESLGDGPPTLPVWPSPPPGLPLHGVDLSAHRGIASLELTTAALPALPGTSARASIGSFAVDHGEGTRYSLSYLHVVTSGAPISTTTLYGIDARITPGPQGDLATSTLGGQIETIAGARAAFHLWPAIDSVAEVGRSWYEAALVGHPGTSTPGGFYHAGFSHTRRQTKLKVDAYRFEARYADAILPYGVPENVWSAAWSWPGVWLKSNYQLVDNTQAPGSNREGYRISYALEGAALQVRASYSSFRQIAPASYGNMRHVGFVEGFFLPQPDDAASLGYEHQYNAWIAWHPRFGSVTLDYADDLLHRSATRLRPQDAVTYQAPQIVLTYSRSLGKRIVADAGIGRYAMHGTWASNLTDVDYFQNVLFAGIEFAQSDRAAGLVQLRHAAFAGMPSAPNERSPNFDATAIIVEERIHP